MIGKSDQTCQFQTCDSESTRRFSEKFYMLDDKLNRVELTRDVRVCRTHTEHTIRRREAGYALWITREGWFYVDDWSWLFYAT